MEPAEHSGSSAARARDRAQLDVAAAFAAVRIETWDLATGRPIARFPPGPPPRNHALGGSRWAFIASPGDTVVIQDVAIGPSRSASRRATGEAGMVAATGNGAGRLILAYGGTTPRSGSIAAVNVTSGVATPYSLSACPDAFALGLMPPAPPRASSSRVFTQPPQTPPATLTPHVSDRRQTLAGFTRSDVPCCVKF